MKTRTFLLAVAIVCAVAISGLGFGLEVGVGTEPSISFAATWDISPSFTAVTSLGALFGGSVQTGSLTVQTMSYTLGVEFRYRAQFQALPIAPYLGIGAFLEFGGGDTALLMASALGMQVNPLPHVHVFVEGAALVPIHDASRWSARLKLGFGYRFGQR